MRAGHAATLETQVENKELPITQLETVTLDDNNYFLL